MAIRFLNSEAPDASAPRKIRFLNTEVPSEVAPVAVKPLAGEGVFPEETLTGTERALGGLLSARMLVPGVSLPLTIAELVNPRLARARELQTGAAAEEALSTITAGLSDALARNAGVPTVGIESARTLAPEAAFLGGTSAVALPAGQLSRAPQTIRGITGAGARIGSLFGGAGGLASAVPEAGGEINPLEASVKTALGAVGGGLLGAVGGGILGRVGVRGITTPIVEKATGLLRGVEEGKVTEVLTKGIPRIAEASGKKTLVGQEAIQAGRKAQTAAINETKDYLKAAEEGGYAMQGNRLLDSGREAILRRYESLNDTPEAVETILAPFAHLQGQISPVRGQRFLMELNTKYDDLVNKSSPEAVAYRAVRGALADQLDDIVKLSSGKDIQPYRDHGLIGEFISGISSRLEEARQGAGASAVPTSAESSLTGARSLGGQILGSIARGARRVARPLAKQGKEFVDEAVEDVVKASPKKVSRKDLPQPSVDFLRSAYLRKAETPSTTQIPVQSIEDVVQARIQQMGPSFRNNPNAASIALRALQAEGVIP